MATEETANVEKDNKEKAETFSQEIIDKAEFQIKRLKRGTAEIISEAGLKLQIMRSLRDNKPLRIKLGLDPTAPHLHLGFAVVLRKLRQFQDLGHVVVLVIGDFTARIGDPTGRSATRKVLSAQDIKANAQTYKEQLARIIDPERTEVRYNSEWLGKMDLSEVISLASKYTVARIMERDDFNNRFRNGISIGVHEFMYPLMQGYDSVNLHSDVEMGGTDQKFNNLVGRELQREYGQEPQSVVLMPILEGLDGVKKMSKSLGNYVGITEKPTDMFLKLMQLPDDKIRRYFELCTDVDMDLCDQWLANENPRDVKRKLAMEIISIYHSRQEAEKADQEWLHTVSLGEVPADIPEFVLESPAFNILDVLVASGISSSKRDARRLMEQKAITIEGKPVEAASIEINEDSNLKVGRKWRRLVIKK